MNATISIEVNLQWSSCFKRLKKKKSYRFVSDLQFKRNLTYRYLHCMCLSRPQVCCSVLSRHTTEIKKKLSTEKSNLIVLKFSKNLQSARPQFHDRFFHLWCLWSKHYILGWSKHLMWLFVVPQSFLCLQIPTTPIQ